ncbi:MAG: hypothetical protein L0212_00320 [Acidobacteria bacterium]|nr:hypothetical protein [Acidobacteriota bacterium]
MLIALAVLACALAAARPAETQALHPADIVKEVDRLAQQSLWPGFDPRLTPVAIYDGERTWLFRHPNPPEGFARDTSREGAWVYPGQHPEVRSNTSINLGGVSTATAILTRTAGRSVTDLAGVVIHETFHVFQRKQHPDWTANEGELFVYPVEDAEALHLRRLETEALRRALLASDKQESAGWARLAIEIRGDRFALLPEGSVGYERVSELNEGLARYVQGRATGEGVENLLPAEEFPAEAVRQRIYPVGRALGVLLDRFDPQWAQKLESGQGKFVDELLEAALERLDAPPREFSAAEREAALRRARADTAALQVKKAKLRDDFLSQAGWKIVLLVEGGEPLWPQGFDPLNVERLGGTDVLHTRFLKLGNSFASLEVLDRRALTEAAGAHPLFNGVRRLTVTGLPTEPTVNVPGEGHKVVVKAEGFQAEVHNAVVDQKLKTVTITLGKPAKP